MKTYQCHKRVQAFRIDGITEGKKVYLSEEHPEGFGVPDKVGLASDGDDFAIVSREWFEKHRPVVSGYFVQYEDGYQSFSPAEAFESGYSLVQSPDVPKPPPPARVND